MFLYMFFYMLMLFTNFSTLKNMQGTEPPPPPAYLDHGKIRARPKCIFPCAPQSHWMWNCTG